MSQNYKDLKPLTAIDVEWSRPVYEGDYMTVEIDGELYARYEYEYGMDLEFTVELPELHQGERVVYTHFDDMGYLIYTGEKSAQNIPAPQLYEQAINDDGDLITGKADYNSELEDKVIVLNEAGEVIGEAEIKEDGSFAVDVTPPLNANETYTLELANKFKSVSHQQTVPAQLEANDDYAEVEVDIEPTITESRDFAYGKPIFGDILGIKQHIFGKQPVLNFTVEEGHTLDATFKAWAGSKVALFDDVKLNLQVKNDQGRWETITKSSSHGLFSKIWHFGERAEIEIKDLPPGEYRVVGSSNSLISLLPAIKLEAEYTDYDHTKVGEVSTGIVTGNVLEDDLITLEEATSVISVNGQEVDQTDGLTLKGEHGTLTIKADGSYTYTSNGKMSSLGQKDIFEYTISDGQSSSSANLEIQTVAPALGNVEANDEVVKAGVEFGHVVDESVLASCTTFNAKGGFFGKPSGSTSFKYVVDENTSADLVITARLPKWSSGTDFVIRVMDGDKVVASEQGSTSKYAHMHGNKFSLNVHALSEGEYRIEVESSRKGWSSGYKVLVDVVETVTHLDQYELVNVTESESANIFDNDVTGSIVKWAIFDGNEFVNVTKSQTILGEYGELTINPNGDYTYKPFNDLPHASNDLVDTFDYRLYGGNGETSDATIKAVVEVSGAGVPSGRGLAFSLLDELVNLDDSDEIAELTAQKSAAFNEFEAVDLEALNVTVDDLLMTDRAEETELSLPINEELNEDVMVVEASEAVEVYDLQDANALLNELLEEQSNFTF